MQELNSLQASSLVTNLEEDHLLDWLRVDST